jgi:hypothetical protein
VPIRFQVDGDFYDHPKTIGLSDAAVALWTRSGSYSAAKLTDGFIAEHVLVLLSRTPVEASEELVGRGLWKRTKGGYRFHQWEERGNLTKERVEAERSSDRQRKRRARQMDGQTTNVQVKTGIVRPESGPESEGNPDGFRGLSVSVSESVSKEQTATPSGFAEFWLTYPKKVGKPAAEKAYKKAVKDGADPSQLVLVAGRFAKRMTDTDPKFICHPTTWLNQARYNDEPEPEAAPVPRRYPPTEVPDWVDPDNPVQYAQWMRKSMQ